MNLNSSKQNHINFCFIATNTIIPNYEYTNKPYRLFLLNNSPPNDSIYAKYICVNCSPRKRSVAKKDPSNPHFRCIERCCTLPYHWNLCNDCIQNIYFPLKVEDPKRRKDALKFQQTFSRLPEDIQHFIREYIPNVFALTKVSSRLFLEKQLKNGSRDLALHLKTQPKKVMQNIYGALICVDFAEKLTRTSLENKHKYIREKTKQLYEYLYDAHCSTLICDEDFWRLRINEGVRHLLKRCEIMEHIKKLLCPIDIRKFCVPISSFGEIVSTCK